MTVWAGSLPSRGETKRFSRRTLQSSFAEAHDDSSPQGEPTLARHIASPAFARPQAFPWGKVAVRPTGELTDEGKVFTLTKQVRTTGYSLISHRSPQFALTASPKGSQRSRGKAAMSNEGGDRHHPPPHPALRATFPSVGEGGKQARRITSPAFSRPKAFSPPVEKVDFRPKGEKTDEG